MPCPICGGELILGIEDFFGKDGLLALPYRKEQFEIATHVEHLLRGAHGYQQEIKIACLDYAKRMRKPKHQWAQFKEDAVKDLGTGELHSGIIEGGTGVGKSLAYLVPACAREGHKIVVATANKSLQKQLLDEDGPRVKEALKKIGKDVKIALQKGKGNYLCMRSYASVKGSSKYIERAKDDHALQDFDQINKPAPVLLDHKVSTCAKEKCKYSSSCKYFQDYLDCVEADIVITNHHTVALEYALRVKTAGRITDRLFGERDAMIIDEAHNFDKTITWAFRNDQDMQIMRDVLDDLDIDEAKQAANKIMELEKHLDVLYHRQAPPILLEASDAENETELFSLVRTVYAKIVMCANYATRRKGEAWKYWRVCEEGINVPSSEVDDAFFAYREWLKTSRRLDTYRTMFSAYDRTEYEVIWFERDDNAAWSMHTAPASIQPLMQYFWSEYPTIMLSATVASQGSLENFRRTLGITQMPKENELIVPSPFSYETRTVLYVTPDKELIKPGWGTTEANLRTYFDRMSDEIAEWLVLSRGRAMVLFASRQDLEEISHRLLEHPDLLNMSLITQGDMSATMMQEKFMEEARLTVNDVPRGGPVMLGLASIWEGISLKYDHMVNVIIPRIPFVSHNDPVQKRRVENLKKYYEAQGFGEKQIRGKVFSETQLHECSIKLRQGSGRLLRTMKDAGMCVILDGRMTHKYYGDKLIADLSVAKNATRDKQAARELFLKIDEGLSRLRKKT